MEGNVLVDIWDVAERPLGAMAGISFVAQAANGASCLFAGSVRDLNQGKKVLAVSYDVFEPLAKQSFADICAEARQKWGTAMSLYVIHAKGRLPVGGISVVIAVGSSHRAQAFAGCRYVIEQIKRRSPIWKLEHYAEGDSEWTRGCELCSHAHEKDGHDQQC